MTDRFFTQRSAAYIIAILAIIVAVVGTAWFVWSKKNVSPEDLVTSLKPRSFQDVLPDDKNFAAVEYLFREGILERNESKIFDPKKVVSRSEWIVLLVKLTEITPDANTYKNCYGDVGEGPGAAAVCFAKKQGWSEVLAQEKKADFNPDNPVKNKEAVGSLSRLMNWKTEKGQEVISNEQAVDLAKERMIFTGNTDGDLTKGDAAGIVFRSVATIPLSNDKFSPKLEGQIERYKIENLIELPKNLNLQRTKEDNYWRRERAKKYALVVGEKAAAEIVAQAEKFEDVFAAQEAEERAYKRKLRQKKMAEVIGEEAAAEVMATTPDGSDAEYSAYLRKLREKKYQELLAEEKAAGRYVSFNILEPLQKVLGAKGGGISMEDLKMYKKSPPHYDVEEQISNPVITNWDSVKITMVVDENYNILSKKDWKRAKYLLGISLGSLYANGESRRVWLGGFKLVDLKTGISEKAASTEWYSLDKLASLFEEGIVGLEVEIGKIITPPLAKLASITPSQMESTRVNGYTDGYFEFLDTATGQPSIALSTAVKPHIIVATDPGGPDVRTWLPIKLELKKDGNVIWTGKIDGNPSVICRGITGCSTNGPSGIGDNWKRIEITAFDKNGKVVATFSETYDRR